MFLVDKLSVVAEEKIVFFLCRKGMVYRGEQNHALSNYLLKNDVNVQLR